MSIDELIALLETQIPIIGLTVGNILMFLIVLIVGVTIVKLVSRRTKKTLLKSKMSEILAEFLTRVLRIVLYIFVVGVSLSYLGIDVGTALISVSVVIGFVLGFALGDTLSNIAAGFMVAITKPFRIDDYVTVNGVSGTVRNVGISVTELDTPDNKHIIIPNKSVWGSNIINFTKNKTRRIEIEIGVGYNEDLDKVLKTTMAILTSHPKVLKDPEPQVAVTKMADSAVNIVIRPWANLEDYWEVFTDINKAIKEGYERAGISIPFPQMDVSENKAPPNFEKSRKQL